MHLYLSRFTSAAQDLVMHSRGKPEGHNWQTSGGAPGTIDDISVFVIPLLPYKREWEAWKRQNDELRQIKSTKLQSPGSSAKPTNVHPVTSHMSTSESWSSALEDRIQTTHQNGIAPLNAPVEVLVSHSDVLGVSELALAEISLEAEEVVVPEDVAGSVGVTVDTNEENITTNGDNAATKGMDPTSANYCER